MQLIRAINKANKSNNSNNTNQTSSTNNNGATNNTNNNNNNKVVIVTPTQPGEKQISSLHVSQNASAVQTSSSSPIPPQPVSPSQSLPPLKKRTSIVKQSVPPPVPPRGSPRSKSNKKFGVFPSRSNRNKSSTVKVDRLKALGYMEEESGNQKVQKWLETVELPQNIITNEVSIHEEFKFKSVKGIVESFSADASRNVNKLALKKNRRVSDCSLVKSRIDVYNSLDRNKGIHKLTPMIDLRSLNETDSGIESSLKTCEKQKEIHKFKKFHQFSRDGELV